MNVAESGREFPIAAAARHTSLRIPFIDTSNKEAIMTSKMKNGLVAVSVIAASILGLASAADARDGHGRHHRHHGWHHDNGWHHGHRHHHRHWHGRTWEAPVYYSAPVYQPLYVPHYSGPPSLNFTIPLR
jgi:hypothetical protein